MATKDKKEVTPDKPKKATKTSPAKEAPAKKPLGKSASAAASKPAPKPAPKPTKKLPTPDKMIEEGDTTRPHGKFVIKKTDKGHFVYKLFASNGRVVAVGQEQYSALGGCKTGIASTQNNAASAPIEDQTLKKWTEEKCPKWQIYLDKKGEFRLRLLASNGNIIAITNDGYLSKDAAKKGILAVARAADGADIVRNDDLW